MPIVVTGSIATDHLMHFPGKFVDSLLPDQLHRVSLSFLVDDLVVRRGGVAANICFGMGLLGVAPVLLDAVGADFDDYASWLQRHGVDTSHVHVFGDVQTARFVCTTDDEMNQIGSFYAGAMARSREIEIAPVATSLGAIDLVMISAGDPEAMVRHADIPTTMFSTQWALFLGLATVKGVTVELDLYVYEGGLVRNVYPALRPNGPNKIIDRPVVRHGQIVVRKMMNISSSFDHRVIDGYDAAEFIQKIKVLLEHPATLFMD